MEAVEEIVERVAVGAHLVERGVEEIVGDGAGARGGADRAEAVLGVAVADRGFFQQVKEALAELKEAREKIKANWAHPKAPGRDDWKEADKEMAELEKAIDMAPTGTPELASTGASVQA